MKSATEQALENDKYLKEALAPPPLPKRKFGSLRLQEKILRVFKLK